MSNAPSTSPAMRLLTFLLLGATLALSAPAAAVPQPPAHSLEPVLGALTADRLFQTSKVGIQVVHVGSGEEVFAWNADQAMSPASTMKTVTAAAALYHLGPSYTWRTEVTTTGTLRGDGVLVGDLHVRGTGDPVLVSERLWKLVRDVRLAGIQRIEGDVVFDASFFEPSATLPGWDKPEDLERGPSYFATLGALSLDFNTVGLVVGPGAAPGEAGRVQLETPASDYVVIDNQVETLAPGRRRWVRIDREVVDGRMRFTVKGGVPAGAEPARYRRTVADPTSHFAAAWAELMKQHGVELAGQYRRGEAPEGARVVAEHVSPPLTSVLMDMNKYSNNFMAEQVLRTLAAEVGGAPGTTERGLELVRQYLDSVGVDRASYQLVNGSGLSRSIRLSPSVLTAVLLDMAADRRVGQEFLATLAIAGRDGTLERRLDEEPGRVRGKTGTLDGVHCLAGYVDADDGERYAFAFLVNDLPGSVAHARELHDRFARALLRLPGDDAVVERTAVD